MQLHIQMYPGISGHSLGLCLVCMKSAVIKLLSSVPVTSMHVTPSQKCGGHERSVT